MSFCSLAIHIYIVKLCVVWANLRIRHVLGNTFQIETGEACASGPKLLWNIKHPDATHDLQKNLIGFRQGLQHVEIGPRHSLSSNSTNSTLFLTITPCHV